MRLWSSFSTYRLKNIAQLLLTPRASPQFNFPSLSFGVPAASCYDLCFLSLFLFYVQLLVFKTNNCHLSFIKHHLRLNCSPALAKRRVQSYIFIVTQIVNGIGWRKTNQGRFYPSSVMQLSIPQRDPTVFAWQQRYCNDNSASMLSSCLNLENAQNCHLTPVSDFCVSLFFFSPPKCTLRTYVFWPSTARSRLFFHSLAPVPMFFYSLTVAQQVVKEEVLWTLKSAYETSFTFLAAIPKEGLRLSHILWTLFPPKLRYK